MKYKQKVIDVKNVWRSFFKFENEACTWFYRLMNLIIRNNILI